MTNHARETFLSSHFHQRAQRSFWVLVTFSILATGALSTALAAPPSHVTGLRVISSGLVLLTSLTLATRVMIAIRRARQRTNRTS